MPHPDSLPTTLPFTRSLNLLLLACTALVTMATPQPALAAQFSGGTYWNGAGLPGLNGGTGEWNATSPNWTDATGAASRIFSGNDAVFAGTAGTVTANNTPGAVSVTSMNFVTGGYTITGNNIALASPQTSIGGATAEIESALTGTGGLVKVGDGTLVLAGANTYSGDTVIARGRILAGANHALSAISATRISSNGTLDLGGTTQTVNALMLDGGTLQSGSLTGSVTSQGGRISDLGGSMSLTVSSGMTTLEGANSFVGPTTVSGASLRVFGALTGSDVAVTTNGEFDVRGVVGGDVTLTSGGAMFGNGSVGSVFNYGGRLS